MGKLCSSSLKQHVLNFWSYPRVAYIPHRIQVTVTLTLPFTLSFASLWGVSTSRWASHSDCCPVLSFCIAALVLAKTYYSIYAKWWLWLLDRSVSVRKNVNAINIICLTYNWFHADKCLSLILQLEPFVNVKVKGKASSLDIAPLTILNSGALQPQKWQLTGNDCGTVAHAVAAQSPR